MSHRAEHRERALRAAGEETGALLRAVLDTAVDGIITIDECGTIETVNRAALGIFGYTRAELVSRNVNVLMPEPYRDEHDQYIANYLRTGEAKIIGIGREVQGRRSDGSVFPADLAVSEVPIPGRRLFAGIVRDISDRKQAEHDARLRLIELAHAERMLELGEMTTGIAHEVNQPLAAIVGFAAASLRMLDAAPQDLDVIRDALREIAEQGDRAGKIIHRLRQLTRKGQTEYVHFDVGQAVRGVLGLLEHDLTRHRVRLELELSSELPRVLADRIQVEQVVINLVRNAVDAMTGVPADTRRLAVEVRGTADSMVEVRITDTGQGFETATPAEVFEIFYTTKATGLGVGLAISRSIIEAHGGRLWAEPGAGSGARFFFTLPVDRD